MQPAAWVKRRRTVRASRCTGQVGVNGQFVAASPAQNRFFLEAVFWPNLLFTAASRFMAFKAGEIFLAAIKLDGNPVNSRMVMGTSCFGIYSNAFYSLTMGHGNSSFLKWE